jgi:hypothetical protein
MASEGLKREKGTAMMAWFAAAETRMGTQNGPYPERPGPARGFCNAMKNILAITAALAICSTPGRAQNAPEPSAPAAGTAPAADDLGDLGAMTFACAKAGLNAAAREAAKASTQGSYQFAFFKIINDTHHSSYEVDFKSNYAGEPDLKYCVAVYCQQGWDPKATTPSVSLIGTAHQSMGMAARGADCGSMQMPVKR